MSPENGHGPLVPVESVPDWLRRLVAGTADLDPTAFRRFAPPNGGGRSAAVLMLLADGATGPDVLLLRRADTLGSHAGQVAFPGGAADPGEGGPVETALREAVEEVGLDPAGVRPVALLPPMYVPVSGFDVTPVLAHWITPSAVRAVDPAETAAVARVPIAHLVTPANRLRVRHPSGFESPAYLFPGMLIWGFTAGLLTVLLTVAGWDRPWDGGVVTDLDSAWRAATALGALDGTLPPAGAEV
ncbi:MAG TPA: CoA pyrophosphatase [Pseudonocardiaceae bacterium]|jgi:8-oxo-dGTP pyrophosphatase MutT (NUDIX family)|nr:CoA pyrophosphatase [Pseudonocardiaceae bacterium]